MSVVAVATALTLAGAYLILRFGAGQENSGRDGTSEEVPLPAALDVLVTDLASAGALPGDCAQASALVGARNLTFEQFAAEVAGVADPETRELLWSMQASVSESLGQCAAGDRAAAELQWASGVAAARAISSRGAE